MTCWACGKGRYDCPHLSFLGELLDTVPKIWVQNAKQMAGVLPYVGHVYSDLKLGACEPTCRRAGVGQDYQRQEGTRHLSCLRYLANSELGCDSRWGK